MLKEERKKDKDEGGRRQARRVRETDRDRDRDGAQKKESCQEINPILLGEEHGISDITSI